MSNSVTITLSEENKDGFLRAVRNGQVRLALEHLAAAVTDEPAVTETPNVESADTSGLMAELQTLKEEVAKLATSRKVTKAPSSSQESEQAA